MPVSRRQFLAAATASPLLAQKRAAAAPPNILLILADDIGSWTLGCYGNKEIRTPNIDALARSGTRFQNHFVCTPSSSASRATLLSGRTPRQTGVIDFLTPQAIDSPPQGQKAAPLSFSSEILISDLLARRGYECGYAGKWHLGADEKPGHGFSYTYTMPGGSGPSQNPQMFLNGEPRQESGYLGELITQRATEFLGRQTSAKPFFLTVGYLEAHPPYEGQPQKYLDLYAKTNFESIGYQNAAPHALREKGMLKDINGNLRKCAASITALDDQIPMLLRKLRQAGLFDNTLIVFTAGNGYLLGRHGLWADGLASDPINLYDEVMATPMIWTWPGRIPTESVRPESVSSYDLLPSLCEVTGAAVPPGRYAGRSYVALAIGKGLPKKTRWPDVVYGDFRSASMARGQRFKLVLRNEGRGPNEFYDLSTDPREMRNQYDNPEYVTVRDDFAKQLEAWLEKYRA